MTKIIEAIYSHGVFEPLEALELLDKQRVELTVRTIPAEDALPEVAKSDTELRAALDEVFGEIDKMDLHLRVRMPTRDEMHERG